MISLKKFITIIISCSITVVLISLFVFVYCYTGVHISNPKQSTDYKWEPFQKKTTMTEGFAYITMDGNGYNNYSDNSNIDILLMGSSHMEAVNVSSDENIGFLINKKQVGLKTYNIGISGHDIYVCAKNIENAVNEYNPDKYVIVETSTVSLDNDKMREVINGELEIIPSYDTGIIYYVQKYCPAIKTLFKSVSDWRSADSRSIESTEEEPCDKDLLNDFLLKMASACTDQKLIIMYHPAYNIDKYGNLVFEENTDAVKAFKSACDDCGILFVDMTDSFTQLYNEKHILAHGFENTAVGEGHLNKYGHAIIAEELVKVIKEDQNESEQF